MKVTSFPPHAVRLRAAKPPVVPAVVLLVVLAILGNEVAHAISSLHATGPFSSRMAHGWVIANLLLAGLSGAIAVLATGRRRLLALALPAGLAALVLAASALLAGQLVSIVMAAVAMTACWELGERTLRALGAHALARLPLGCWLTGLGVLGVCTLLLGRAGLATWWAIGVPVLLAGSAGLVRLGARLRAGRTQLEAYLSAPLPAACGGLAVLLTAWAAIYTAAPETGFDSLNYKAYLPQLWAHTGQITASPQHVQLNGWGFAELLAMGGQLFGGHATGRYLQLLAGLCLVASVWWWGRRHGPFGPLAGLTVAAVPAVFWQQTTAYEDLLISLGALAVAIAVVEAVRAGESAASARGVSVAVGLMAGTCLSLKLTIGPLGAGFGLAWVLAAGSWAGGLRRVGPTLLGAAITAAPLLLMRWIDLGNPVLPAFNNVFHSPDWPLVSDRFESHGLEAGSGLLRAQWYAVFRPRSLADPVPGGMGILAVSATLGLLVAAPRLRRSGGVRAAWFGLLVGLAFWWLNFRILRYLFPVSTVGVALVLMALPARRLRAGVEQGGVLLAVLIAAVAFPMALTELFSVPNKRPPVGILSGQWSTADYQRRALHAYRALKTFNALSPPGAHLVGTTSVRTALTGGRMIYLPFEVGGYLKGRRIYPVAGSPEGAWTLPNMRRLGIGWGLLAGAQRGTEPSLTGDATHSLTAMLLHHGVPVASADGIDLYRLAERPPAPRMLPLCDPDFFGNGACWGLSFDGRVGLNAADGRVALQRVATCPGQTLAVYATETASDDGHPDAAGGVVVSFDGPHAIDGYSSDVLTTGQTARLLATAPPGATRAAIHLTPPPAGTVSSVRVGFFGRACG